MTAPNVEECLTAAAVAILTDGRKHQHQALMWAQRFLRAAARGRSTAFQRRIRTTRVRAFAQEH